MVISNKEISRKLRDHANELAHHGDNLYRIRAFRQAAVAVLDLPQEVSAIVASSGQKALEQFPGIGKSLAETIVGYVLTSAETGTIAT